MTISFDASQLSLGVACAETHTGGAWSVQEQAMHINSLSATLVVKTFLKDTSGISVLFQLDNATAVAHINNMGGAVLCQLTGAMDVGSRQGHCACSVSPVSPVSLTHSRTVADTESWTVQDRSDWMLCPHIF